ncbi:MAG: helix-turn-helix domain-containing protein [Halobacteriales archaeon]|nr:helix-turn-helix domain-containing protein [Halobacteriales archaeon]
MRLESQKSYILRCLEAYSHSDHHRKKGYRGVCAYRFLDEGMPRYAARVHELRQEGHRIETERCKEHHHESVAIRYRLIPKEDT